MVVDAVEQSVVEASFDLTVNSHNLTQNPSSAAKYKFAKLAKNERNILQQFKRKKASGRI